MSLWILKKLPGDGVVLFAAGFEEGGLVGDGALCWAGGLGVVGVGFGDGVAFLEVFYVVPAEGLAGFVAGWLVGVGVGLGVEAVAGAFFEVGFDGVAGEADADESFAGGEDDAAVLVVPGVGFVLAHDGELDAVDGEQFIEGHAEGLGDEYVDFEQGLAADVVGAHGVVALPVWGELAEEVLRQHFGTGVIAVGLDAPLLPGEVGVPARLPEVAVVASKSC